MKFTRTSIHDVILIDLKVHGDERGYFTETFRKDSLEQFLGYSVNFIQDNESKSSLGVLRGLHYQLPPVAQAKLVRVLQGKILDVALDIRKSSPSFGKHVAIELSAAKQQQLFIPAGFAHGFLVLEEGTIINYKVDNYYSPEHERGIAFNDPAINIDWGMSTNEIQLSAKDAKQPLLAQADVFK